MLPLLPPSAIARNHLELLISASRHCQLYQLVKVYYKLHSMHPRLLIILTGQSTALNKSRCSRQLWCETPSEHIYTASAILTPIQSS